MKPNLAIPDKARKEIATLLSKLLADEFLLQTKTRNAHWNTVGPDFHSMHAFFGEQHEWLDESIDEIAERIRTLGHAAPGSLAEMLNQARITELHGDERASSAFTAALLADHETIIRQLRQDAPRCARLDDDGTNDFLVGLMEKHEKTAWMLRASLG